MNFTHYTNPLDGRQYVRVSLVLALLHDEGLYQWREIVGREEANRRVAEAADTGTEIHDITRHFDIAGELPDIPERSLIPVMRYITWKEKYVTRILKREEVFYSAKHGFACTVDLIAQILTNKLPQICDLKSGAIKKKKFALQMGAYWIAVREMGIETGVPLILPLDKKEDAVDKMVKAIPMENYLEAGDAFLDLLSVYRFMTGEIWKP